MARWLSLLSLWLSVSRLQGGWVDRDTPLSGLSTHSYTDGELLRLVFSDEFNEAGRSFRDGDDPRWTSMHKDDYTNFALQFYHQDLASTSNGFLNISTVIRDISFDVNDILNANNKRKTKNYQSGMVQGWNKFCFTGGTLEIRARLPGKAYTGGLWPAMWLLGNLARATYVGSSNNVWPWSYDTCAAGLQDQQKFSACNNVNHYDLHSMQGRGAPEIDLLEAMPGKEKLINTPVSKPYFSTSLQVAPGLDKGEYRPTTGEAPPEGFWYDRGLEYGPNTSLNIFFYGMHLAGDQKKNSYLADAISANTNLQPTHFDEFHTYRLEWEPYLRAPTEEGRAAERKTRRPSVTPTASPSPLNNEEPDAQNHYQDEDPSSTHKDKSSNGQDKDKDKDGDEDEDADWGQGGYLRWYLDGEFLYSIDSSTLAGKTGAVIPQEPMYIILNTAISSTWGFPSPCPEGCPCECFDCRLYECQCGCPTNMCENLPAHFLIDWVRVFQRTVGGTESAVQGQQGQMGRAVDKGSHQGPDPGPGIGSRSEPASDTDTDTDTGTDTDTDIGTDSEAAGVAGAAATQRRGNLNLQSPRSAAGWRYEDRAAYGAASGAVLGAGPGGHIVGCSTPSHPTSTYIKGYPALFMKKGDVQPLKSVSVGGAACGEGGGGGGGGGGSRDAASVCGPHGTCTHKKCLCDAGYTGPSCRSQLGFDDTNWEPQPDMSIFTPSLPLPLISMALLLGVGLIVATAYRFWQDRETRGLHRAPFMGWVMGTRGGYKSLDHTVRTGIDESGGAGGPAGSRGSGGVEVEEAGQWGGVWGGYQEVRPQPRNGNARVLVRE